MGVELLVTEIVTLVFSVAIGGAIISNIVHSEKLPKWGKPLLILATIAVIFSAFYFTFTDFLKDNGY